MKDRILFGFILAFLVVIGIVAALDFDPRGNIIGRGVWNITGFVFVNMTTLYVSENATADYFLGKVSCTEIWNGTDGDFCDDATGAGEAYDLNMTTDSGSGVILDSEILNISGAGSVSTSMSGNIVTITGTENGDRWNISTSKWIYNNSNILEWNETEGNATYLDNTDTQKNASTPYLYNDSTTIHLNETVLNNTIDQRENNTQKFGGSPYLYNDSTAIYLNETVLNNTIDDRENDTDTYNTTEEMQDAVGSAFDETLNYTDASNSMGINRTWGDDQWLDDTTIGNCSVDQSCSAIIYDTDESNLNVNSSDYWDTLSSINTTQFENDGGLLHIVAAWLTGYIDTWLGTKDTDDLTEGSTNLYDNQSFNETWTDTQYADISVTGDNTSWNESWADTQYADISVIGDNTSWNETWATSLYSLITEPLWSANYSAYNTTWSSTFNTTYDALVSDNTSWNETWADTLYALITEPLWAANYSAYNNSWSTTFNATYDALTTDNASWNETWADTQYIDVADESNLNVNNSNSTDYWGNCARGADCLQSEDIGDIDIIDIEGDVRTYWRIGGDSEIQGVNFTTTANNTGQLGNSTAWWAEMWSMVLYEGGQALSSVYCTLTGCTMAGNLNMSNNNITDIDYVKIGNFCMYDDGENLTFSGSC